MKPLANDMSRYRGTSMRRFILVAIVPLLALWDGGMSLSSHLMTINGRPRVVGVGVAGNAPTSSSSSLSWKQQRRRQVA